MTPEMVELLVELARTPGLLESLRKLEVLGVGFNALSVLLWLVVLREVRHLRHLVTDLEPRVLQLEQRDGKPLPHQPRR